MSIPFIREDKLPTGTVEELGRPGGVRLRRIRCDNPGPFTFRGTNTYLIGEGEVALLDPGPADPAHHDAILRALPGERLTHILVSHTHRDHSPGAAALKASTGAATFGFGPHLTPPAEGGDGGDHEFHPDRRLADGETLRGEGWRLTALHTPGHCANHLCFALEESGVLFSGDHVMSWSTSVVVPPDGDMADYMAALRRLADRDDQLFLPGHGAPLPEPIAFTRALLAHRQAREDGLLEILGRHGPATVGELVPFLYIGLEPRLRPAAAKSLLAHLRKLETEGAVQAAADGAWAVRGRQP
ncbi:MBL fold metallo-hydrolase [Teichococcus oryzae]|uniref:MBL fold metallo-hydrolase n=1 Tax=Teichococcus oryzae TaxID=1608942 RepID=A0A5B2TIV1_9PROT|nr:MBL fold metallo-hydrolase [Pseudoroseomonas oryzae]KAA2214401.1 MBL fold metallo-hydrolase [Pseudoroseomonas oryzae]